MRPATLADVSRGSQNGKTQLLLCAALAALGVAGCGGAPTVAPAAEAHAPTADAVQFSAERFDANLRALVAARAHSDGNEAFEDARRWMQANTGTTHANAQIVLAAALGTREVAGDALVRESSSAAFVVEVARALSSRGEPVAVVLHDGEVLPEPALARAELVVYIRHACGLPPRRDLLSHRVLRERFFRAANANAAGFEQAEAPHAALLAAGAKRVVALDGFAASGGECHPAAFGDAMLRFVSEANALLTRGRSNSAPPVASQGP